MSHMFAKKDRFKFVKSFRGYFLSSDIWDPSICNIKYKSSRMDEVQDILRKMS